MQEYNPWYLWGKSTRRKYMRKTSQKGFPNCSWKEQFQIKYVNIAPPQRWHSHWCTYYILSRPFNIWSPYQTITDVKFLKSIETVFDWAKNWQTTTVCTYVKQKQEWEVKGKTISKIFRYDSYRICNILAVDGAHVVQYIVNCSAQHHSQTPYAI